MGCFGKKKVQKSGEKTMTLGGGRGTLSTLGKEPNRAERWGGGNLKLEFRITIEDILSWIPGGTCISKGERRGF